MTHEPNSNTDECSDGGKNFFPATSEFSFLLGLKLYDGASVDAFNHGVWRS